MSDYPCALSLCVGIYRALLIAASTPLFILATMPGIWIQESHLWNEASLTLHLRILKEEEKSSAETQGIQFYENKIDWKYRILSLLCPTALRPVSSVERVHPAPL